MAVFKLLKGCMRNENSIVREKNVTDNDKRRRSRSAKDRQVVSAVLKDRPSTSHSHKVDKESSKSKNIPPDSMLCSIDNVSNTFSTNNSTREARKAASFKLQRRDKIESDSLQPIMRIQSRYMLNNEERAFSTSPKHSGFNSPRSVYQHGRDQRTRSVSAASTPTLKQRGTIGQIGGSMKVRHVPSLRDFMVDPLSVNSPHEIRPGSSHRLFQRPSKTRVKDQTGSNLISPKSCSLEQSGDCATLTNAIIRSRSSNFRVSFQATPIVHETLHGDIYCRKPANSLEQMSMMEIYRSLMVYKLTEMRVHESSLHLSYKHLSNLKGKDKDRMMRDLHSIMDEHIYTKSEDNVHYL